MPACRARGRPAAAIRENRAGRCAHHLVDGDGERLELGQVLVRRRREVEFALGRQHQGMALTVNCLLTEAMKTGVRPDRHAELDAGEAVALAQLDLAAAHDGDDGTGEPCFV